MKIFYSFACLLGVAALLPSGAPSAHAQGIFIVPGTADFTSLVDTGFYAGGTTLNVTASGIQDSNTSNHYFTDANGALVAPTTLFNYAAAGSTNYPIVNGQGDGINHYVGGGTNYNTAISLIAYAGKASTDTTDPATIRFGALVGTFSSNPVNNVDWFLVGTQSLVRIPTGGAHLYLADNDDPGRNFNNGGQFTVVVGVVPEPGNAALLAGLSAVGAGCFVRRRKQAA